MFKPVLDLLAQRFSGERARRHVEEIIRFHRIQASPGLRAASGYAYDHWRSLGLKADILRFPGDGKTRYWSALMPQEWQCSEARLRLVSAGDQAGLLADVAEHPLALIQRSAPTPDGGSEAEVVALDNGTAEQHYTDLDVAGKLVLTNGNIRRVHDLAVQRRGALGIIYDGMRAQPPVRPAGDLPDARQYTSFWWRPEDRRCFGFVLTPRQGRQLRRTISAARAKGESVRLHALVDSRFYDGHMDAPTALLAGETEEEVLIVAHLCHPQPSANDNASGAATVLEIARVLQTAIAEGALPKPRRSIRFLLPPEIYGTFAYLASDERRIGRTLAAINLDMVGENQELCGSSFLVERLPQALAAPVDVLAVAIQEALAQDFTPVGEVGSYALFRHASTPFNGGSDHYVLCDPSIGIACPMIIQWPDRFYHTTYDTIDKVDPASLRRAGLLAATYAYVLANAGAEEASWLAYEVHTRYKAQIARLGHAAATEARVDCAAASAAPEATARTLADRRQRLQAKLLFLAERHELSLDWLERLGGDRLTRLLRSLQSEAAALAWHESTATGELIEGIASRAGLSMPPAASERDRNEWERQAQAITPMRLLRAPVSLDSYLSRLSAEQRDAWHAIEQAHGDTPGVILDLLLYWADGRRTLLEIADLVELETGARDVAFMVEYGRLLHELGLIVNK